MKKKRKTILILVLLLISVQIIAQTKTFSGVVADENGSLLPGVTIHIKGEKKGTITDTQGHFKIDVDSKSTVLVFSYLGMKDLEYHLTAKSTSPVTITMESDSYMMNETVVTGYQKLKRENATGSFQTISATDLDNKYMSNLTEGLEGKIAGLVKYNNGVSDGLTIRGVGSLKASTSPLVVVDGLPINGTLQDVNQYDIDKITVLKDAAAAAIYGARASNGVIVIVTKKAQNEKLSIEFNSDLTLNNKNNYDDYRYCNASEQLEIEQDNFNWMCNNENAYSYLMKQYKRRGSLMTPITRLMIQHKNGTVSDDVYNNTINTWSKNSYRDEWQDEMEHNRFVQQYNLGLRTKGRYLNSSIIINWKGDNTQEVNQYNNQLSLQYTGNVVVTKWMNLDFGTTINNTRSKSNVNGYMGLCELTSFAEYQSMYNEDGSPARLKGYVALDEPSLSNAAYGLKDEGFVPLDELHKNYEKGRNTYTRSFIHLNVYPIPELKLSAMFQYEDMNVRSENLIEGDSYSMRHLYNLYTSNGVHYLPEGGLMTVKSGESNYYTFRTQATYDKTFAEKHEINAVAGFEYRQTYDRTTTNQMYGYDEQTLTNTTGLVNFKDLVNLQTTDLGSLYSPEYCLVSSDVADVTHVKHKYQSYYATANYTYDKRYSASASYRVDKADLFGADSKFRSRPLWSTGISWNMQNENFMKRLTWIDMLKLRVSYGVMGNINSNYSSYLTATIGTSDLYGDKTATLNTPPNDQLRWEKTRTWDAGFDFSILSHRLTGSFDVYNKKGSDILSNIDIDPTTGWNSLYTNNANTVNKGFELQLSGDILKAVNTDNVGISADFTLAYNKNKITKLNHVPTSGSSALNSYREGDPVNSLYSFRFDHVGTDENGYQQIYWKKADGTISNENLYSSTFTPQDIEYCGSLDPKWSGSFTPTITYKRFSLSGMFVFYAGHYFRATADEWTIDNSYSYGSAVPKSYLKYWRASEQERKGMLGNGYMMKDIHIYTDDLYYCDQDVDHADYMKLRNIVLGYNFSDNICHRLGLASLRLRLQMNNVCTWVRNKAGIDPEQVNPVTGKIGLRTPKSYTFSINANF